MGRAIAIFFFIVCFLVFVAIKAAATGAKAAYEAVFDPGAKEERIRAILRNCYERVTRAIRQRHDGRTETLRILIAEQVPAVQAYIFDQGYKVPADMARRLVCTAIVDANLASEDQVRHAAA
jgi:hypothetical protein